MNLSIFIFSCLLSYLSAQNPDKIYSSKQEFDKSPQKYFFFKNSKVLLLHESGKDTIWRTENAGRDWQQVNTVPSSGAKALLQHPFDENKGFVLTQSKLYFTQDRGSHWVEYALPLEPQSLDKTSIEFHATRSNYLIFMGKDCATSSSGFKICNTKAYYSKNNGESFQTLRTSVKKCMWSVSSEQLLHLPVEQIFCQEWSDKSELKTNEDLELSVTNDYFSSVQRIVFDNGKTKGVLGFGAVSKFLVVAFRPSLSDLDMYVSVDGLNFANVQFPEGSLLKENAYTVLESSTQSLLVDIFISNGWNKEFGSLYSSNSNGTYFTKSLDHTNRNSAGIVDYEKVQGVEGIFLANIVSNADRLGSDNGLPQSKQIESRISFNNGATWSYLSYPKSALNGDFQCATRDRTPDEKCALHLHSVTNPKNYGYVYSDAGAPGFIIGVGNVGDYLLEYEQCDTFLSTDGGLSWKMIKEGAHKYETGDMGGLLVLVDDEQPTDSVWYSFDYGENWHQYNFGVTMKPKLLITDPDSTSRTFMLFGNTLRSESKNYVIVHLDFDQLMERKCQESDMQYWTARNLNTDLECLLGHKQKIQRRKPEARCFVGEDFKQPVMHEENCQCSREDFECDFNYILKGEQCVAVYPEVHPIGECQNIKDTYLGSRGYRKIPGDTCLNDDQWLKPIQKPCSEAKSPEQKDNILKYKTIFDSQVTSKAYFPNTTNMILKTASGAVYISPDEEKHWQLVEIDGKPTGSSIKVFLIRLHDHQKERVFLITETNKVYYSSDFGHSFSQLSLPDDVVPNLLGLEYFDFHPTEPDYLLFIGSTQCPLCHSKAYFSPNNGKHWQFIDSYVSKCLFALDTEFLNVEKNAIFCSVYRNQNGNQDEWHNRAHTQDGNDLQLKKYLDFGTGMRMILADDVVEYYVFQEFMAIATELNGRVRLYISQDGSTMKEAQFSSIEQQGMDRNAFTVLQSNTGRVFLDMYTNSQVGRESGRLYKSDSSGVYYTLSLDGTNRNLRGLVDFERVQSMRGVILANVVTPSSTTTGSIVEKRVESRISFDDGGSWQPLSTPLTKDGQKYDCSKLGFTSEQCHLHLHSRTELNQPGPMYSQKSAVGLILGVGNVGPYLLDYTQYGNTYLSSDGGQSWFEIMQGPSLFEYGDSGALLVLVNHLIPTNVLMYSWDHGRTFKEFVFSEELVRVEELLMEPSSTSKSFLISGYQQQSAKQQQSRDSESSDMSMNPIRDLAELLSKLFNGQSYQSQYLIFNIDFSQIRQPLCTQSDYEDWNPTQPGCILGLDQTFKVRKSTSTCSINRLYEGPPVREDKCKCSKEDYECDIGYIRDTEGGEGCLPIGKHKEQPEECSGWFEGSAGMRRNPSSKCIGEVVFKPKQFKCFTDTTTTTPNSDSIVSMNTFQNPIEQILYFKHTKTILLKDTQGHLFISNNDGSSFKPFHPQSRFTHVLQNEYFKERVYLLTDSQEHWMTVDGGLAFVKFRTELLPNSFGAPILEFHAEEKDWLIFTGNQCTSNNGECHTIAYYTKSNGKQWTYLLSHVYDCEWTRDLQFKHVPRSRIFCTQSLHTESERQSLYGPKYLFKSDDFFTDGNSKVLVSNQSVLGFAMSESYMVLAIQSEQQLILKTSIDSNTFHTAQFPQNTEISTLGYTVLESDSGTVYLTIYHQQSNLLYGDLYQSNQGGQFYSLLLERVNRDQEGYVDFEKILGIRGMYIVNQIQFGGSMKQLRTLMTRNDGLSWDLLPMPNNENGCQNCSLHLHLYTERSRVKNELSDEYAYGMMIGVGNVGHYLTEYQMGNTYLSYDFGQSFIRIANGPHLFEFGDHGTLLLLVPSKSPTQYILYSLVQKENVEESFVKMKISQDPILVEKIVNDQSGGSSSFLLVGMTQTPNPKPVTIRIDFKTLRERQCTNEDLEYFPKEPECVFGLKYQKQRRKKNRNCYISQHLTLQSKSEPCYCQLWDYECEDYYLRNATKQCQLIDGAEVGWTECLDGRMYLRNTGYRQKSKSQCRGGVQLGSTVVKDCGMSLSSSGSIIGWIIGIFSMIGLVVGLGYWFIRRRGERYIQLPTNTSTSSHTYRTIKYWNAIGKASGWIGMRIKRMGYGIWYRFRRRDYEPVSTSIDGAEVLMDDYGEGSVY